MRIPHEKRPLRVAQTEPFLLVMQYRFYILASKDSITSCNLPDPDIFAFHIQRRLLRCREFRVQLRAMKCKHVWVWKLVMLTGES